MHLKGWLVSAKQHGWWAIPLVIFALTSASYWISGVNAGTDLSKANSIIVNTALPEIRQQMATTNERLERIDERTQEMNQRLANIEGRVRR